MSEKNKAYKKNAVTNKKWRENYERIFGKKKEVRSPESKKTS